MSADRVIRVVGGFLGIVAAGWLALLIAGLGGARPLSPAAIALDLVLVGGFGLLHSLTATTAVRGRLERRSVALPRAAHLAGSLVGVAALAALWRPVGGTLWTAEGLAGSALDSAYWVLLAVGSLAIVQLDPLAFFGLRAEQAGGAFVVRGQYRLVRHPLYTMIILALPATSVLTGDRAVLAIGFTVYILSALPREEGKLLDRFGSAYADYRDRVGALVPRLSRAPAAAVASGPGSGA